MPDSDVLDLSYQFITVYTICILESQCSNMYNNETKYSLCKVLNMMSSYGFFQEFFGQLDQRVLNTFLKACDELTDILPEQEQQSLQETVRKLHKHWKVGVKDV